MDGAVLEAKREGYAMFKVPRRRRRAIEKREWDFSRELLSKLRDLGAEIVVDEVVRCAGVDESPLSCCSSLENVNFKHEGLGRVGG